MPAVKTGENVKQAGKSASTGGVVGALRTVNEVIEENDLLNTDLARLLSTAHTLRDNMVAVLSEEPTMAEDLVCKSRTVPLARSLQEHRSTIAGIQNLLDDLNARLGV